MKKVLLKIDGMTCSACSSGLEKYLNKQEGIRLATVNLVMNNASVEYDDSKLSLEDVEKFVEKAGFKSLGIDNFKDEENKQNNEKYKLIIIGILSVLVLYVSMAHMVGLPNLPFLDMQKFPIAYSIVLFVLTTVVIILGRDIIKNGYKNLIHKTPNMDTLVMIGTMSSFIYSVYATIQILVGNTNYVENLYYDSASMVILFIKLGKFIENKNKDKTKEALKKLMNITPKTALVLKGTQEVMVTIDEIQKGDIVICKPGEKIAVDGEIIDGNTHIDESFITGESKPVKKTKGSEVIAGSINYEGTIKYKAVKIGKDSTVSEIVRLVANATSTKAPIAKIADKISSYFVPIVLVIAMIAFVVWMIVSKDLTFSLNIFISVLLVACPCSLGLATPLAIVISSGKASTKGILIKTSEALENSHKVKTICFDKTGTLTNGDLRVYKLYNYSDMSEEKMLQKIAALEGKSEHPIANAIVKYAKDKKIQFDEIKNSEVIPGFGIKGENQKGDCILIGNRKLMEQNGVKIENSPDEEYLVQNGNSLIFASVNGNLVSLIGVKDTLKENVSLVIKRLKQRNINVVMLTGDNEKVAKSVAKECGIDNVIAEVTPKEKAEHIKKLKENGILMMCGDGINDSVSLVTSDIGVSMSSGTDIAIDSAQVIIMNNDLNKINDLLDISGKTISNIKQNLFWAFFYNVCMILVACGVLIPKMGITLNPMIAALAMTLSSLSVVLNALRLRL